MTLTDTRTCILTEADVLAGGGPCSTHDHEVDRVELFGSVEFCDSVNSLLFAEMVRRATPHMTHYQGDLFHDAKWMMKHITGPTTFYWAHRDMGTDIGTDLAYLKASTAMSHCIGFYRIDVVSERHGWAAIFTSLLP